MQILNPLPNAVLARDEKNLASVKLAGLATVDDGAEVYCRFTGKGIPEQLAQWTLVDKVMAGTFGADIPGLPVGGPYQLQVKIADETASVKNLLVGDLYILAGQSNMDGCGRLMGLETPNNKVRCFYYDDRWDVAQDPFCWYNEAVDPVHWNAPEADLAKAAQYDRDFRTLGAGLGVRFGKDILKATGVPVGLVTCSHGGTSLAQWSPKLINEGGRSLYGSLIRRAQLLGGPFKGVLWYQGESDAATDDGKKYRRNLTNFIKALRKDLNQPELPFLQVQLANLLIDMEVFPHWDAVQADQMLVEKDLSGVFTVTALDLHLDDAIHVSTAGMRTLGARLALVTRREIYGDKSVENGPRFKSLELSDDRMEMKLYFSGVNKKLCADNPVQGFTIEAKGQLVAMHERKVTGPDCVTLKFREPLPKGFKLWYGLGYNPAVNLADTAGIACPAFGPVGEK